MFEILRRSSTSLLRVMLDRFDPFKEESSASLLRIVFLICLICWGRVFYFLGRDGVFDVFEPLKIVLDVLDPLGMIFDVLEPLKMVLYVLDPLGMVFDVLDWGKKLLLALSFDNFVLNYGNLKMSFPF
nr:hypothetical protein CFP56_33894 [Quercus suber]